MEVFKTTRIVVENDLDDLNHVNNVRYLQWVQDIAEAHWKNKASETLQYNHYWVVLNHNITYKQAAVLNDKLTIETYVKMSQGVTSTRVVTIYNSQNNLLVECETKWCFMNRQSHKIARLTDKVIALFN